jgi:hypothetical protein
LGGDFNVDFGRSKRFDKCLSKFIKREKLTNCEKLNELNCNYTYENGNYKAFLDHIFMYNTSEFEKQVTSISSNIYVDILKTSDHHPINIEYVLTDEIYKVHQVINVRF